MLARLGERISRVFRASAPDPFVIAILLTVVTLILVLVRTPMGVGDAVGAWSGANGLWKFLSFGMQMCLILVTGHALASSPPMERLLDGLSSLPRSPFGAVVIVCVVATTLGVINWGLGLIGGALIARRVGVAMARRGIRVHYPLLAASGYTGLMVWHGGFSGTAPLKVTTEGEIASVLPTGVTMDPIALSETLLSPLNLVVTGGLLVLTPLVMGLLHPKGDGASIEEPSVFVPVDEQVEVEVHGETRSRFVRFLEDSPVMSLLLAAMIGWWAWGYYLPGEGSSGVLRLTPDTVNLTMLLVGLVLHGSPMRYARAVEEGARGCAGIILQFPLYAGIMGMMHESGLTQQLADGIASLGNETTLPVFTFVSAGVVNMFVPSGGGQWGVQGPIVVQGAVDGGIPVAKMVMSLAYGDQLTNMLQPFWALPLLAVTGVRARDIVGYTAVLMVIASIWVMLVLVLM
ncbi:MAG: short-chain fatty acid transporter [Planctomycetota bacterium]|jgi:short-chain fatty acids transporter